jgi:anti-sigma-K factor RskA
VTESADDTTRAASYALGALTPDERREFERELRRSPRLAAEVREFTETTAVLGLATPPVAPPPQLRASILDRLDDTAQVSRVVRGPWFTRPVAALIGAAAAVLIAVGGIAVGINLTPQRSPVDQIMATADHERASLDLEGGGNVTAVWSPSLERAAITVRDLEPLPSSRTYQVWFIDPAGTATPAGTFDMAGAPQSMMLTGEMDAGDAIGITIEPAGGSTEPTTDPIAVIPT